MHSSMSPIVRIHIKIFQLLGFFNVSLSSSPKRKRLIERFLRIWSTLLLLLFITLTANTFTNKKPFLFTDDAFGYFNDSLKVALAQFTIFTIYLETIWQREQLRIFWNIYAKLHYECSKEKLNWRPQLYQHIRFLGIFYGILITEFIFEMLFVFKRDMTQHLILFWSMFTPYVYAVHFRNMQFIFHMEIIRLELVILERDLKLLVDYMRFAKRVTVFDGFEEFMRRKLVEKQKIYSCIYEMMDNFQKAFGLSMVIVLLMIYVRLLVDAYFAYYTKYRATFGLDNMLLVPSVFEIPALLITSKNCMNMVKYIAYQLHNILSQVEHPSISVQIQNFSLQIMHQKIRIDGIGITTLDGYMLSRALGSVTTYMIFFIQFMPKFNL